MKPSPVWTSSDEIPHRPHPWVRSRLDSRVDRRLLAPHQRVGRMTSARRNELKEAIDRARRAQLAVQRVDELEHKLQAAHVKLSKMKARRDALQAGTARGWWHPAARHLHQKGFTYQQIADIFDVHFDTVRVACNPQYRQRKLVKDRDRQRHLRAVA